MTGFAFLVIDRDSGTPIMTEEMRFEDGLADSVLLGGFVSAVSRLLEEIKLGQIKIVQTEEYTLISELSERFILVVIGEFTRSGLVLATLKKLGAFLDEHIPENIHFEDIPSEVISYVEDFLSQQSVLWTDSLIRSGILRRRGVAGFKVLSGDLDNESESELLSFLSSIVPTKLPNDLAFFLPLNNELIVLGYIYPHAEGPIVFYTAFGKQMFHTMWSFKHVFSYVAKQTLEKNLDRLNVLQSNQAEILGVIGEFTEQFKNHFSSEVPSLELDLFEVLIDLLDEDFGKLLANIQLGRPVAVYSSSAKDAEPLINLLSYVCEISSVSTDLSEEFPQRITWSPPDFKEIYLKLNYVLVNLVSGKVTNAIKVEYWENKTKSIFKHVPDGSRVNAFREEFHKVFSDAIIALNNILQGETISSVLKAVPDKRYQKLLKEVIASLNPLIFQPPISMATSEIKW